MSERKVLNKYYPPDFDPSKIPRMKLPKNRQYTVRLMAPCNMRCKTCGEYIYKGKKFNARKEDVEGQDYLGIRIYRFYIKCTRCLQEISFKTDPRNTDYEIEAGATRNFMALKLAEEQAQREEDERKEEEATNPMKLLENRTQQSKNELELLESLEELKDLNRRQHSVDTLVDTLLNRYDDTEARKRLAEQQEEEDEKLVKSIYGPSISNKAKRVIEEEIIEDVDEEPEKTRVTIEPPKKQLKSSFASSSSGSGTISAGSSTASKPLVTTANKPTANGASWNKSVGLMKKSTGLAGLVRKKGTQAQTTTAAVESKPPTTNGSTPAPVPTDTAPKAPPAPSGLSLLGSYSDSGSDSDN
ncbi:splicing factor YJU2 [Thrips palmi]|uniref:Splicing factor YJU2 n=1 Tax=Thrips palmi TaxID=161013 RepID=A0A6P8Z3L0_THRPL|nr:splicing factor YJU2 [Thrips palmi]